MKEILLNKGLVAKVDDEDYDSLNQYKWRAKRDRHTYYAYRRELAGKKERQIAMHRQILDAPKGMQVDHRDWDGLNNQRSNIRLCTANDNCRWVRPRSNTGFLGVSRHLSTSTNGTIHIYYTADLKCNGEVFHLYHGKDVIEAAKAYNAKAKELFGEFGNLNIIPETIMEEKKYEAERQGHYGGAKLTVMQPRVVNQNNVPREVPSESVASNPLSKNEENIYKMLHEFRNWNREWNTFMAKHPASADEFVKSLAKRYVVSPVENVASDGETPIDDVNLDYLSEDGK